MFRRDPRSRHFWAPIAIAVLCLAYGSLLLIYDWRSSVNRGTDVIEYISASQDLLNYDNQWHGPGLSAAILVASKVLPFLPPLTIARVVSTLSALSVLVAVYQLGRKVWNDSVAGLIAAAALTFSVEYWLSATNGLSDTLATAFMLASALGLWHARAGKRWWSAGWAGLAAGAAYLTRYISGYTMIGAALLLFVTRPKPFSHCLRDMGLFVAGFLIPAAPWLIRSYHLWGNPLWNLNHINAATKMLGMDAQRPDLVSLQQFPTLLSVIAYDPSLFFRSWLLTFLELPISILREVPLVGHLAVVGLVLMCYRIVRYRQAGGRYLIVINLVILGYGALVSMVWSRGRPARWLIPLFPFVTVYVGMVHKTITEWIGSHPILGPSHCRIRTAWILGIIMPLAIAGGIALTAPTIRERMEFVTKREPYEYGAVADCLRSVSKDDDVILSTAPQIPFLAGRTASAELLILEDITPGLLVEWLREVNTDYLVVESRLGLQKFPNIRYLLSPMSRRVPADLEPVCVFSKPKAVVYRVASYQKSVSSSERSHFEMISVGPYQLGEGILLVGYSAHLITDPEGGSNLEVVLYWRALRQVDHDYTVFVHLVNEHDEIVTQHDGPPQSGEMPTSSWIPQGLVIDRHTMPLPDGMQARQYQLAVGLYSLHSMERLRVVDLVTGSSVEQDRIMIEVPEDDQFGSLAPGTPMRISR